MGVFDGLANFLFGVDPINDVAIRQQAELLQRQSQSYQSREQQDYVAQQQYLRDLQARAAGTAPSVAQNQLQAGLDTLNRQQQSATAGASGSNGALAGYGAMLAEGQNAAALQQQQSLLRAQETANALGMQGQTLNSMGARSQAGYGTALNAALGYSGQNLSAQEANQKARSAATGTLLSTAGALGGALLGGGAPLALSASSGGANAATSGGGDNGYSAAAPGYAASGSAGPAGYGYALSDPTIGASDMPQDPYQAGANYSNGAYRTASPSIGQR